MNAFFGEQSERVLGVANAAAERFRHIPGASVVEETFRSYSADRASLLAAALSYYTLLSLFPLMLFILAIVSPFLQSDSAIRAVSGFVGSYLPVGAAVLRNNLEQVARLRGPLTIVGAGSFLWSASGVFDLIQLGLNRAFRVQHPRPLWRQRLVSVVMVISVSVLFGLSFLLTTLLRLAIHYGFLPRQNAIVDYVPPIGAVILGFIVFGMLYRYIPYVPGIQWRHVALGAFLASLAWEGAKLGFAWYLTNYALLNLVYGSVGAIIAVMLWGYITAVILLLGAEFVAVLAGARKNPETGREWWAQIAIDAPRSDAVDDNAQRH